MKFIKCMTTAIICIVLMLAMSAASVAEEVGTLEEYQAVLDELNAEYGYNVHFPTEEEKEKYGIVTKPIEMSVEEYRKYMRRMILADMAANFKQTPAPDAVSVGEQERGMKELAVDRALSLFTEQYGKTADSAFAIRHAYTLEVVDREALNDTGKTVFDNCDIAVYLVIEQYVSGFPIAHTMELAYKMDADGNACREDGLLAGFDMNAWETDFAGVEIAETTTIERQP